MWLRLAVGHRAPGVRGRLRDVASSGSEASRPEAAGLTTSKITQSGSSLGRRPALFEEERNSRTGVVRGPGSAVWEPHRGRAGARRSGARATARAGCESRPGKGAALNRHGTKG
ncbi:hypothetical protein GCM10010277_58570 [Streptomyces longisporoflavus]|nr:hypothetical protein GCM10010277_58570 [Streptomyces longisporoflavus]